MEVTKNYIEICEKTDLFNSIFGYSGPFPFYVVYGPQELCDEYERLLDKSLKDKVDYLADHVGYDPEVVKKRQQAEMEAMKEYFY